MAHCVFQVQKLVSSGWRNTNCRLLFMKIPLGPYEVKADNIAVVTILCIVATHCDPPGQVEN